MAARGLADDAARRQAIAVHDRSFLVEAGAGSGKTAVMAGRVALLLARGIPPRSIAAVTFTEFAASELFIRVKAFVDALARGDIPAELRVALPHGLTDEELRCLAAAQDAIDDMTCSTIHGFCQRLITPYPVEADIDPGAVVMDRDQADLAFAEVVDSWLRSELAGPAAGLLAELVVHDPAATVGLVHTLLDHLRRHRTLAPHETEDVEALAAAFRAAVDGFCGFLSGTEAEETDTAGIAARFRELAGETGSALSSRPAAAIVVPLAAQPQSELVTGTGGFRAYQKKGKWRQAAKRAGLGQAEGDRLNAAATGHYERCGQAWTALRQAAAERVLAELLPLVRPVVDRFRDHKRSAALLDFDDLIFTARDLLAQHHHGVRRALAERFTHVLVDEFQDTDLLQAEIFWRLCGDPPAGGDVKDWQAFRLRPGALFLVGDPKQAIYRFRGADIAAYVRAREAFAAQAPDGVLSITTNFRSCPAIMAYVNDRFAGPLAAENGQPGFQALDAFQDDRAAGPSIAALDVEVAVEGGKADATSQRDAEAEAVAALCARLIDGEWIRHPKSGEQRKCRAGDIALLAPTGSDLWRYEEALERHGIAVATQAGKGLYRRQEVQDLIAVTRVLEDRRDTLALGALLRGPLVGLSEEELLDIVWALPRRDDTPDDLPRLDVCVSPEAVIHPLARDVLERLQALRRQVNTTTPHHLLAQAVDVLRVRPILRRRHEGQAERALANVDLYLSLSRAYAVRGLRAFSDAMTASWSDESRAPEGRPDAQEEAVALYTMHAAKGLEWPVVIPVNTMTRVRSADSAVTDRRSGRFYCRVFGVQPTGLEEARAAEQGELERERVRLWYVAATRARELLILPRLDDDAAASAWKSVVDLGLPALPALQVDHPPAAIGTGAAGATNAQSRSRFVSESGAAAAYRRSLAWRAPSREEGGDAAVAGEEEAPLMASDGEGVPAEAATASVVQGGRQRGRIVHKLLEEVLTGETPETAAALAARATTLIRSLGRPVADDPARGLAPAELAAVVLRALALPAVAALRPGLTPEFPVYASTTTDDHEEATAGIVDAIAFSPDGSPAVVIDWKTDVDPSPETLEHYRAQVRAYLDATGAPRGLVVAVTSGTVLTVLPTRDGGRP